MNDKNFIKKLCENASLRGQAQAYDFALFLVEKYGDDLERVKAELKEKSKEANEGGKACLK